MKSFISSLSKVNDRTSIEHDNVKDFYSKNENSFRILQQNARRALIKPILPRSKSQQTRLPALSSYSHTKRKIYRTPPRKEKREEDPFKYSNEPNFRNYALPKSSNYGPQKYYNSITTQRFVAEQVVEFMEQVANPDPSLAPLYQGGVDPVLHVGEFNDLEINWQKQIPKNVAV